MMERVNRILQNPHYQELLGEIAECEKDRIFCHHDMAHFLDVARIASILSLEEGLDIPREIIYAAALLHDIGRHLQYREKIPHERASAELAPEFLKDAGFSEKESKEILEAILMHRTRESAGRRDLTGVIYRADKLSRSCFACPAEKLCDWDITKKNMRISI